MKEVDYLKDFETNNGITVDLIESSIIDKLPDEYLNFMKKYNGGAGFIGEEYLTLFKIEEIDKINNDYGVEEFDEDIVLIGSNSASEAIALDFRDKKTKYILIPSLFDYEAIIELSDSLYGFFKRVFETGYFD